MSCSGYDPRHVIQLDGSRYASFNCGCAVTVNALDDATCGAKHSTPTAIRNIMNDFRGGTNLGQADAALATFGVALDVRYRLPWAEYERLRTSGRGAYLAIGYRPLLGTRFQGSTTFTGNHGIYDPPSGRVRDPLADGRKTGIYKFANEVYPRDLIRRAAGMLNLESRSGYPPRYLGAGYVYAGFTVDNDVEPPQYAVTMAPGPLDWWRVVDGKADRYIRSAITAGFTRRCDPPKRYPWPGHTLNGSQLYVTLLRIKDGPAAGRYLALNQPRLTLRTL